MHIFKIISNNYFIILICSISAIFLYINVNNFEYNIDDGYVIDFVENSELPLYRQLGEIFTSRYNEGPEGEYVDYGYRPMGRASFAIEKALFGKIKPGTSHVINILIYSLCIFLLGLFLITVNRNIKSSILFFTLIIFTIHPLHVEVVASLKNREELLGLLFALVSMLSYLNFINSQKRGTLSLVLCFISLIIAAYSKESYISVAGVLFVMAFIYKPLHIYTTKIVEKINKDKCHIFFIKNYYKYSNYSWPIIFGISAIITTLVLPLFYLKNSVKTNTYFAVDPYAYDVPLNRLPNTANTLVFYLEHLIWPNKIVFYYGYNMLPSATWLDWRVYLGITIFTISIALVVLGLRSSRINENKEAVFGILTFYLNILFAINLLATMNGIVADRFIFFASVPFSLLLVLANEKIASTLQKFFKISPSISYALYIPIFFYTIFLANLTSVRIPDWKNKATLYMADANKLTNSARGNVIIGSFLANEATRLVELNANSIIVKNKIDSADIFFSRALLVDSTYPAAWDACARLNLIYLNDPEKARSAAESAIFFDPFPPKRTYLLAANISQSQDDWKSYSSYMYSALSLGPDPALYDEYIKIMVQNKQLDDAYKKSSLLKDQLKDYYGIWLFMSDYTLYEKHDTANALRYYDKVIDLGYSNPTILQHIRQLKTSN